MVFQVLHQSITKSNKVRTGLQEVIFIILEELLDLFFHSSLEQPLYSTFSLLALLGELLGIRILLAKRLLYDTGNLVQESELLIVVKMGLNILSDGNQWHWCPGQALAEYVHLQKRFQLFILPQF